MGYNAGDRILETTTSTGTGNISLAGAVTGYRTFASIATADGDQFPYVIAGSSEWEVGIGTRVSSTTFSRSPTASSNAGALVNFSAGTKEVWIDWTNSHITSLAAKNFLINNGMQVSQFSGTTAVAVTTSLDTYIVDCWLIYEDSSLVITGQQISTSGIGGFDKAVEIKATTGGSLGVSESARYIQYIEGYKWAKTRFGSGDAQSVAVGFWIYATTAGPVSVCLSNPAFNRHYANDVTINSANTWEYKTVVIPGDTAGTWPTDNGRGLILQIILANSYTPAAAGWVTPTFPGGNSTFNRFASTNNIVRITGVSLIPGVVPVTADQSPHTIRSFDEELTLCQRYYEKSFDYATAPVQNAGVNTAETTMPSPVATGTARLPWVAHRVRKRAAPTFTIYNPQAANAQVRNNSTATDCSASSSVPWEAGHWVFATVPASSTAGDRLNYHWVADARL
jgi:hypothetical protein